VAMKKAKTSALFEMETQTVDNYSKAGGDAHGLELTNGNLVTFAGGIPFGNVDGHMIGSIGVSGDVGSRLCSRSKRPISIESLITRKGDHSHAGDIDHGCRLRIW